MHQTAGSDVGNEDNRRGMLVRLSDDLRALNDPDEVIGAASQMLGETLGAGQVGYAEVDDTGEYVSIERDWNDGTIPSNARRHRLEEFGPAFIADLRRGHTIVISNVEADDRTSSAAALATFAQASICAFLNVPLVKDGRLSAVFAVHNREARPWSIAEVRFAEDVAERTWMALSRVRAESALRQSEARYRTLHAAAERKAAELQAVLESMPDAVYFGGPEGMTLVNQVALDQLGFSTREELRRNIAELANDVDTCDAVTGEFIPPEKQAFARAARGERVIQDVQIRHRKSGDARIVRCAAAPVVIDGQVIAAVAVNTDVTDIRRTEQALRELNETLEQRVAERSDELVHAHEQLRHAQKLEAMGTLTGGVAHDFNNLLTPIIGSLDMLMRRSGSSERERRLIDGALQSAERAKVLVQRLLAFARRQPLQSTAVDIKTLAEGMAGLIETTLGPQIDLQLKIASDMPPAMTDLSQFEMALLNLAVNARDAMPEGGVLTIGAAEEAIQPGHRTRLANGSYIRLWVDDTGTGMDEATIKRAAEPFFSTKGIGKGTGLGLSMVHGLVAQLGGVLLINSTPGAGTCIEIWLPVGPSVAVSPSSGDLTNQLLSARGTALLVDDEELVRMTTADMLLEIGFIVLEAETAQDALRFLDGGAEPDVIVTDHLMPGMTGAELARTVLAGRPDMHVLIVSGYAEAEGIPADLPRLTKPFRQADLAQALATLMSDSDNTLITKT